MNGPHDVEWTITRKVVLYERALCQVLRRRPPGERDAPMTDAEHQLAAQLAEAVTAYELGLRERRAPPPRAPTPDKGPPAQVAVPAGRGAPRQKPGRKPKATGRLAKRQGAKAPTEAKEGTE